MSPFADTTDVETDVVAGDCLGDFFVVHLDGLDFTLLFAGMKETFIPFFTIPVSTRPTGTVPIPLML